LVWPALDRQRGDLLRAVALGPRGLEARRRRRGEPHRQILAAVVADGQRVLEARLGGAAQRRQLGLQVQARGQLVGQRHLEGQLGLDVARTVGAQQQRLGPAALARRHLDAQLQIDRLADVGHRRGDRLAAAEEFGLPALGQARHRQIDRRRRQTVIAQLELDRRGLAGGDADCRIVGDQEDPLDVGRVGGAHGCGQRHAGQDQPGVLHVFPPSGIAVLWAHESEESGGIFKAQARPAKRHAVAPGICLTRRR